MIDISIESVYSKNVGNGVSEMLQFFTGLSLVIVAASINDNVSLLVTLLTGVPGLVIMARGVYDMITLE